MVKTFNSIIWKLLWMFLAAVSWTFYLHISLFCETNQLGKQNVGFLLFLTVNC